MTTDTIKVMTALQLRKAVKDAGHDPMGPDFGKGNPETMRAFLHALYTPPPNMPSGISSAKWESEPLPTQIRVGEQLAALQEEHEIVSKPLYGAEAISAARNGTPVLPMSSASYEQFKDRKEKQSSGAYTQDMTELYSLMQQVTTLELRVAMLEQLLKISNGSTVAAPAQPDPYAALAQYLHATEDGPELVLTVSQVPALTLEQKLLVLKLFGDTDSIVNSATPPRILNQRIVTALQRIIK